MSNFFLIIIYTNIYKLYNINMSCNLECNNVTTLTQFESRYNNDFKPNYKLQKVDKTNKVNNTSCDIAYTFESINPTSRLTTGTDYRRVNYVADSSCNWSVSNMNDVRSGSTVDPTYIDIEDEPYDSSNISISNIFRQIPNDLLLNNNIFLNTYNKARRVYINKFNNRVVITLRATVNNLSIQIVNNTNEILIDTTLLTTASRSFTLNNYDRPFFIIRRNDTIGNQNVILESVSFNGSLLPLQSHIRAELNYNQSTDPERFNRVLNGTFSWSTSYRISLFTSYIKNLYVENINHTNNVYGNEPHILTITSLINIPTEAEYIFRVQYNNSYKIYINNWKSLIMIGKSDKQSIPDKIPAGIYMIYIEKEYNPLSSNFVLSYSIDNGRTWLSIDNLLLNLQSDTFTTKDKLIFYNSMLNYCSTSTNYNIKQCSDFFNTSLENNLFQLYNNLINTNYYPTATNGRTLDTWYINNGNNQVLTADLNNIEKTNVCGKNIVATKNIVSGRYGGITPNKETRNLDIPCWDDNNLVKFYCPDITECDTEINNVKSLKDYETFRFQILSPLTDVANCNKKAVLQNMSLISSCYSDFRGQPVSALNLFGGDEILLPARNRIYSNIGYSNNFTWISSNNRYKLVMQSNGNLVQFAIRGTNEIQIWQTNTSNNNNARLCLQRDGNMVIYSIAGAVLWSSGTSGQNTYAILGTSGFLMLYNSNDTINKSINFIVNSTNFSLLSYNPDWIDNQIRGVLLSSVFEKLIAEPHIIYPNILYNNDFTWRFGNCRLVIQSNGNLVCFLNNVELWSSGTAGNNNAYFGIQRNGEMKIYKPDKTVIWSYPTSAGAGGYGAIDEMGYLRLINKDGRIEDMIPTIESVRNYLMNTHWNNSPWTIFSDKAGRVWQATWSILNQNLNITYTDRFKRYAEATCGAIDKNDFCPFRGWRMPADINAKEWNVNQLNLTSPFGYKTELNNHKPVIDKDSNEYNYRSKEDRHNFERIDKYQLRKPPQLKDGKEKPTYIPGYQMISYSNGSDNDNTFNFLIAARGGANRDQAFTVFHILKDSNTFAEDILANNPELVTNIRNHLLSHYSKYRASWSTNFGSLLNNRLDGKSSFQNKETSIMQSLFTKLNPLSYFTNNNSGQCDFKNIDSDPNCTNNPLVKIYNQYIKSTNNYCLTDNKNLLTDDCKNFYNKKIIDNNTGEIVFDMTKSDPNYSTGLNILCDQPDNYLTDLCINNNKNSEEQLKKQINYCKMHKDKRCDELCDIYKDTIFNEEYCKSWLWLIILVVIIAIFGSGFIFYKKKNKKNNTTTNIQKV